MTDLISAERFFTLLDDEGEFTFQTFGERCPVSSHVARVFHGSFEEHSPELARLNELGAGIFVMVNAGDGIVHDGSKTCRTAANVIRIRALFVDLDGAPIGPVLTSGRLPDWVVQSSPGKWHAYWIVDDCRLDQFRSAQTALAERFSGDLAVKDLPRVMRIPGVVHQKAEPFLSQLYLPTDYDQIKDQDHD